MPWVRLDEDFPDHPKVVTAGPLAGWMHVCALAYCNRHLTDGFVPHAQIARLVNFAGIVDLDEDPGPIDARDLPDVSPYDLAERLVNLGIWEKRQGGYLIHDFLDYQPSRAEIEAQRKVKKDAGRAGGVRSGVSRRSRTEAEPKQNTKQTGSRTEAEHEAQREANRQAKPKPVPDTDTDTSVYKSSSSLDRVAPEVAEEEEIPNRTTAVRLVAERRLAARTGPPITNPTAWLHAVCGEIIRDHGSELDAMDEQGLSAKTMADRIMPAPKNPYAVVEGSVWDDIDTDGYAVPRRAG